MANEIKVDLKLGTASLKQQGVEAGRLINEGVKQGGPGGVGADYKERVQAAMDKWRADNKAIDAHNRALRSGGGKPPIIPPPVASAAGGASPFGGGKGLSALSVSGIPYISTLARAALSPVGLAAAAAGIAIMAMRSAIHRMTEEAQRSAQIWARAAMGGKPIGFAVSQNNFASVLGVSEDQVMQFGKAIGMLNAKLAVANIAMARNNSTLTASAQNANIASVNWNAMWSDIAAGFSTAKNRWNEMSAAFSKMNIASGFAKTLGIVFGSMADIITRLIASIAAAVGAIELIFTALADWINVIAEMINNLLARFHVPGFKEEHDQTSDKAFKNTKDVYDGFVQELKAIFSMPNPYMDKASSPGGNSMRLPASALEKMGLVIGNGPSQNHAAKTAQNTTEILAQLLILNSRIVSERISKEAPANAL